MSQAVIVGVLVCLSAGLVKGQLGAWFHDGDVYIYPRVELAYNATASECQKYNAIPANLNNETVRNGILAGRQGQKNNDQVWNFNNNRNMTSDLCNTVNLVTGETSELNCSETRPFVCVGSAWTNLTQHTGDNFGFSNVKLRYTDASRVCESKGNELELPGNVVFVTSSELQGYLSTFTKNSDVGYWLNRAYKDSTNTSRYENWVENRTVVADLADLCVQMKPDGKWDNMICHGQIRFICEWKKIVSSTTGPAHVTEPDKDTGTTKTSTTTMSPKTVTTKNVMTKTMEYTTVTATTSGSVIIQSSIYMTIAVVAINVFLA